MQRTAAEQSTALPSVAQDVRAPAAPIGTILHVAGVDPDGDAMRDVFCFFLTPMERRFDVAGAQAAVAADVDGVGALDRDLQRLQARATDPPA